MLGLIKEHITKQLFYLGQISEIIETQNIKENKTVVSKLEKIKYDVETVLQMLTREPIKKRMKSSNEDVGVTDDETDR